MRRQQRGSIDFFATEICLPPDSASKRISCEELFFLRRVDAVEVHTAKHREGQVEGVLLVPDKVLLVEGTILREVLRIAHAEEVGVQGKVLVAKIPVNEDCQILANQTSDVRLHEDRRRARRMVREVVVDRVRNLAEEDRKDCGAKEVDLLEVEDRVHSTNMRRAEAEGRKERVGAEEEHAHRR